MHLLIKHIKHFSLNPFIKHLWCLLFILASLLIGSNCGKRKPPLPPVEKVAQRVSINGTQIGNQIRIIWQMPARNVSDSSILNISRADIYRLAEPKNASLSLTEEEFASRSTLIGSIDLENSDFALKEKTYIDTLQFAGQEARLRYAIRFVNSSGQKAAFSNFLLIEPSARIAFNPTTLKSLVNQENILLSWIAPNSNVDGSTPANIIGYNIYRSSNDEETRRLNDNPINSVQFEDSFFTFENTYKYFVRTVSLGNNSEQVESLSSPTIEITPKDLFAPSPPNAITIAAAPNNISIFFAINIEKDVNGYRIYRTTDPNKPKSDWDLITKDLLETNTFQDTKVESGKIYFYYLLAVDKFGNVSEPSDVVSETGF